MIRSLLDLWRAVWASPSETDGGYGQSWLDDVQSARRFNALARQPLVWLPSCAYAGDVYADFPIIEKFADFVLAYRQDEEGDCFILERVWHGWPDPPEFALVTFDRDKRIMCGHDFDAWPELWTKPPERGAPGGQASDAVRRTMPSG